MKKLAAYFSATGVTAAVANIIAEKTGAELYQIVPKEPYTTADLDWENNQSRSSREMRDQKYRPELAGIGLDIAQYDLIFIGAPIWWYSMPRIINSFIESLDWTGKRVTLFATSRGSGIATVDSELRKAYPQIDWQYGRMLTNPPDEAVLAKWFEQLGI